jgi:hypothetical protein
VAKKKSASRKSAPAKKRTSRARPKSTADTSRLDTAPLQDHIRKRIKELEGKSAGRSAAAARQGDDTLERLKMALETLEDICFPTMTVPI